MGTKKPLSFQEIISCLQDYWQKHGCMLWLPYHEQVGAGTGNPATALRVLGPEPWNVAYVEPSFRADDGRYGDNPNRVQMHHQFQVILQPTPDDPLALYLGSLVALGIKIEEHDIRFVEDNWESPALGAWGLGWEVWLDGMEVTQFTYFQQAGGRIVDPVATEITYGLERVAMYLQDVNSIWDINWDNRQTYGDILKVQEIEFCKYNFDFAEVEKLREMYVLYREEAKTCIKHKLVIPAHDYVLRCSQTFNVLDARGAIGLAERVKYFGEMRGLTRQVSDLFYEQREEQGFPLLVHMPKLAETKLEPMPKAENTPQDFVLEIGVEELAATVPDMLIKQLQTSVPEFLAEARLKFDAIAVNATPRRLVLEVKSVAPRQADLDLKVKGPRRDVCEKNPKALEGFCKKNGIQLNEVTYEVDQGTEYATASIHKEGKPAAEALSNLLPDLIAKLRADKNMRWLASGQVGDVASTVFNRPIRWLVALYGSEIVPFKYANICSGRISRGGRWSNSHGIKISSAQEYRKTIAANQIVLSPHDRKEQIRDLVKKTAAQHDGTVNIDESLLDEVNYLVEYPMAFLGSFDERFRSLPPAVLTSVMKKHLRVFPVLNSAGVIFAFIGVRNGSNDYIEIVQKGYERVISARFSDAEFFVSRDKEKKLQDMLERIKTLAFVEKLGSMYEKGERVRALSKDLVNGVLCIGVDNKTLDRAAALAKADLGSQMVIEMSSLQGEMGRFYAINSGESPQVAQAIKEQYLPGFAGDRVPESNEGLVLSVADKLDSVCALFSIGAEPTGSADPYALRREGLGIISCLLQKNLSISLHKAVTAALDRLNVKDLGGVRGKVIDFLNKRLEIVLRDNGARYDVVRAVLARSSDDPYKASQLVRDLEAVLTDAAMQPATTAYLRCLRIVDHATEKGVRISANVVPALLQDAQEKLLYEQLSKVRLVDNAEIKSSFLQVKSLVDAINAFFDKVMVMAPDTALRDNRLALAQRIVDFLSGSVDLRQLEGV